MIWILRDKTTPRSAATSAFQLRKTSCLSLNRIAHGALKTRVSGQVAR